MIPAEFHFLRPWWLAAFLPLILLVWRTFRSTGSAGVWQGVVDAHLLPHLLESGGGRGARLPVLLVAVGGAVAILALAGPTWQRLPQPVFQPEQCRVLVLDISPSMNAPDVAPSRLAQARFEILDLLKSGEGQTALIAYGAEPYVVSPLTGDGETIALQVPELNSELLPIQGKDAARALDKAGELLRQAAAHDADVILVTDGLDDPAAAGQSAERLRDAGHRVSVLSIGTAQGAPVPTAGGGFIKDASGAILLPRLDAASLRLLTERGGGRYVPSRPDDRDIEMLEADVAADQALLDDNEMQSDQWREEGPWLLLALLPLAALGFRRGWFGPLLLLLLITPPDPALAFEWQDLWQTRDQQAAERMGQGDARRAAELFEKPDWRAAAHYRAGDYAQALESIDGTDPRAQYNRGNSLARLGRLDEAVDAYEQALAKNPDDEDARFNNELVEALLEQQKKQQQNGESEDTEQDQQSSESEQNQNGESGQDKSEQERPQEQNNQGGESNAGGGESAQNDAGETGASEQDEQEQNAAEPNAQAAPADEQAGEQAAQETEQDVGQAPSPGNETDPSQDQKEPGIQDLTGEQPETGTPGRAATSEPENGRLPESAQATEQWLRRVPDDPGGLLRQRFLLQHLRNTGRLPE